MEPHPSRIAMKAPYPYDVSFGLLYDVDSVANNERTAGGARAHLGGLCLRSLVIAAPFPPQ